MPTLTPEIIALLELLPIAAYGELEAFLCDLNEFHATRAAYKAAMGNAEPERSEYDTQDMVIKPQGKNNNLH